MFSIACQQQLPETVLTEKQTNQKNNVQDSATCFGFHQVDILSDSSSNVSGQWRSTGVMRPAINTIDFFFCFYVETFVWSSQGVAL